MEGLVKESGFHPKECEADEDSIYVFILETEIACKQGLGQKEKESLRV